MSDFLTPFLLNEKPVRGRMVRLTDSVNTILRQHNYPKRISELLAETLVMAAILSSNLKSDGVFTVQVQSKGALSLLVVDATADGSLRGYAQFDEAADLTAPLPELCAEGYLAITLDSGADTQRYQGIVPLEGDSIAESIQHYFTQSQQLMVRCKLAVSQDQGAWIAAGMFIEHLPESAAASDESDAWREARILLETVKDAELLDTNLAQEDLLYRLFHEDGVWVYDPKPIGAKCRCSRDKILNALSGQAPESLAEMAEDGEIPVDCQFCGARETFTLAQLAG